MRMSSFVVDFVICRSIAQTFSFTTAIVDNGSTELNVDLAS